jgi:hypothetical protein
MSQNKTTPAPLVGKKIRQLRKDRNLTQAELAARIGVQQSDLCRMETGEYKVSLEALFKILRIFGMSIAEFFHEENHAAAGVDRDRDSEMLAQFRRLKPESQEQVLEFLRFKLHQESDLTQKAPS